MKVNLEDYGVEFEQHECPACKGQGEVLGFVENQAYYRCQSEACKRQFRVTAISAGGQVFCSAVTVDGFPVEIT